MNSSRRTFLKTAALGTAGLAMTAKSYSRILGANDRVRVGVVGFSNRAKGSLIPSFQAHAGDMNFEIVAVSDLWNRRREEGSAFLKEHTGNKVYAARNNQELYEWKEGLDAVIISTADFQHALHLVQAIRGGCDAYCEKPFAETMADARAGLKAANESDRVVQIGSQRRSGKNYWAAYDYINSGRFGDITMVEMTWNVNQPGRWRRPDLVADIRQSDVDWDRYQMNRPRTAWDPRKYLEYRLFWPYSSGIPGQWMSHQIDTVHWFSGLKHPRSVSANGGIYQWKDGRSNFDTMTAVFDYGPNDDMGKGFQVLYSSRFHNSAGGTKEIYYSNGGELNLKTNKVTPNGGLSERHAKAMDMKPNQLAEFSLAEAAAKIATSANTGNDNTTSNHMRNWMDCVRSRKATNAPVEVGYYHSIANIMTTAALRTGKRTTFDEQRQEVLAGGEVFKY
ncbi:MAG: Gfo/Idh/MocA family oxidoreductase [Bacteroidota bacterium]